MRPARGRPGFELGPALLRWLTEPQRAIRTDYNLLISGLSRRSKREVAIALLMELRGLSEDEARDLCRSPIVPALKGVSREVAEAAELRFRSAEIRCRITKRRRRR